MSKLLIFWNLSKLTTLQGVRIIFVLKPRNKSFSNQSTYNIDEKERKKLFSKTLNIESNKSDIKEVSECDDELVNEKFHYDAV